jgi:S-layer family protein
MTRWLFRALVLTLPSAAFAQAPAGPDFRVNTYTAGHEFLHRTSVGRNGDFVVTWTGYHDGSALGAFGQRFDAGGTALGGEFLVGSVTTGYQAVAVPAVGPRGDFVVAWWDSATPTGLALKARRFDRGGVPVGAELEVTTQATTAEAFPGMGRTPDGGFVVAWCGNADGSGKSIAARRYDGQGAPRGPEFVVNTYTTGDQRYPSVDTDAAGNFVVLWRDETLGRDGSGFALFAQRYDAAGGRLGGEFQVNSYTTGDPRGASVSMAPDGGFVATWTSQVDGTLFGVSARRFDAAGSALGPEFAVNAYTFGVQITDVDAVAHDGGGNFVISWWGLPGPDVWAQRFDAAGNRRGQEFMVNSSTTSSQSQTSASVASDEVGNLVVAWEDQFAAGGGDVMGRRVGGLYPRLLRVDVPGNGVLEPGEAREIRPTWRNATGGAQLLTTVLSSPGGPPGGVPQILDPAGAYGTVADGLTVECTGCPVVAIPAPSPRPAVHWDASVVETVVPDVQGQQKTWTIHVGNSFADVPPTNPFYRFIETLLHLGVTGGCNAIGYCPGASTTREQMAVFVLVAREGGWFVPPACATPMFGDVPASSPFCRWIEELSRRGVVGGCGGGNYCPASPVSREQMAVFALRTLDATLTPPACATPMFADVPASSPFCRWIEELARRGVVGGCGGGNYCPAAAVSREQMGVFLGLTFGLQLYGS